MADFEVLWIPRRTLSPMTWATIRKAETGRDWSYLAHWSTLWGAVSGHREGCVSFRLEAFHKGLKMSSFRVSPTPPRGDGGCGEGLFMFTKDALVCQTFCQGFAKSSL